MKRFLLAALKRSVSLLHIFRSLAVVRIRRYEAKLKGVAGFTGVGVFRYTAKPPARIRYELEVKGVAGLKAELWLRGAFITEFELDNGKATIDLASGRSVPAIGALEGEAVVVRQNGDPILSGRLGHA
jgi:hypothetical protein